jgi:hypothetical protein
MTVYVVGYFIDKRICYSDWSGEWYSHLYTSKYTLDSLRFSGQLAII